MSVCRCLCCPVVLLCFCFVSVCVCGCVCVSACVCARACYFWSSCCTCKFLVTFLFVFHCRSLVVRRFHIYTRVNLIVVHVVRFWSECGARSRFFRFAPPFRLFVFSDVREAVGSFFVFVVFVPRFRLPTKVAYVMLFHVLSNS